MAEYRVGRWDAALKAEETSLKLRGEGSHGYAYDWVLMTLIHARRGEMDKACEWLARRPSKFEPGIMADTPRDLYDEAAAMIRSTTRAAGTPPR